MANARRVAVWTIAALLFGAAQANAVHPLAGTWLNVDENTSSITRLEVSEEAGGWVIHAWGKCGPPDCDWGAVPLHMAVGEADARGKPLDAGKLKYGAAYWDHKDKDIRTFMTLQVQDGELVVESFDVFGKASGRPKEMHHTRAKDSFKKAE
jgi:hypothetical protein